MSLARFSYGTRTWRRARRVIARIELGPKGRNPRFVVTNLDGQAQELYERVYCQRGEMENRLKEQQLDLFADRTSSSKWWTNQYRVLIAALAYTLLETICVSVNRLRLIGTSWLGYRARNLQLQSVYSAGKLTRSRGPCVQQGADTWAASGFFGISLNLLERVYGHHHPDSLRSAVEAMERNCEASQILGS